MKLQTPAFVVLAASSQALASWSDWVSGDPTVTVTATRTIQYCPCNGEVRVTPVAAANGGDPAKDVQIFTKTGAPYDAHATGGPGKTVTKAGPIVVVFTTAGSLTTKTGIVIELKPTGGAPGHVTTKTIFTGPQPTDDLAWIDWDNVDPDEDGATLTRTHTQTATVYGPAPTGADYEPWADWVDPTKAATTTKKATSSGAGPVVGSTTSQAPPKWWSTTQAASSSSSNAVGPIGGSTSTGWGYSSSWSSSYSSSASSVVGPIDGATTSSGWGYSSSSWSSSYTSSASNGVGPIDGATTSSTYVSSTTVAASSSTSATSDQGPILGSTSSSVAVPTTSLSSTVDTGASSSTSVTPSSSQSTSVVATTTTGVAGPPTVTVDVSALSYADGILRAHNVHRANHSAADLTWSDALANIAAQTVATCIYAHNVAIGGGGYGQNIGAGYTPALVPSMIGNDMYNREMPNFPGPYDSNSVDFTQPSFAFWGHFSQIVWKSTTQVGCATQLCPNLVNFGANSYFTVCNYFPQGNILGAGANIGAPLGLPYTVIFPGA